MTGHDLSAPAARPKLIYLVTEDWYFWSHRLPMAEAARDAGFDVAVACRVRAHGERIRAHGITVHPLRWRRDRVGLVSLVRDVAEIVRLYRRERPAIVHHVALRAVVLGSMAAALAGLTGVVNALTGLGYLFTGNGAKARLLRQPVVLAMRLLLNRGNSRVILQNDDDRAYLQRLGAIRPERAVTIRGSGIDTERFRPQPEPPGIPVTAAYVGRMLEDKGVRPLVEAVRQLAGTGTPVRLLLAGQPDPDNPTTIPESTLRDWTRDDGIEWLGHVDDVRDVWSRSHIAVLASRREGLPKSLLEAAACGRPIVATDVPGCREIARDGENAILVPPDDAGPLARALATLAADPALRARYGHASRQIVLSDMSVAQVGRAVVAVYRQILDGGGDAEAPDRMTGFI